MIIRFLKFTMTFVISFIILSFPINQRTIFHHITNQTRPYTSKIFSSLHKQLGNSIDETKKFGKKLFSNADPEDIDKIDSISSANKKIRSSINQNHNAHHESYSNEEIEQLRSLLTEQ